MRREQELLDRRKQAMLSQLTSLSALAAETAQSLPEVPALELSDLDETRVNQPVSLDPADSTEETPGLASASSR